MTRKGKKTALLWVWKGHLELIKSEVDRALMMVLDGLEKLGSTRPKCKKGKKKRAFKRKHRPICEPKPISIMVSKEELGCLAGSDPSSYTNLCRARDFVGGSCSTKGCSWGRLT